MWSLVVLIFIVAIFEAFLSFSCFKKSKDTNNNEKLRTSYKRVSVMTLVLAIVFIGANIFYFIPESIEYDNANIISSNQNISSSNKKEKCAWCGKKVSKDDMRGKWCKDCQKNAFGKDGWYYDLKD